MATFGERVNEGYPEVPGLLFLADYFGVSLDYLMGRKDERM